MAGQDRLTEWDHRGHLFGRGIDDLGCGAGLAGACFKTRATVVLALLELVHELSPVRLMRLERFGCQADRAPRFPVPT
ncbi:hypothetical protein WL24_22505 [Burkholderia ubonensis]|nr:hypothetical protein WL24_22505 [Burkholderia ubonensis]